MKNVDKASAVFSAVAADQLTAENTERVFRIFRDASHLESLSHQWRNVRSDIAQGHLFEQLEVLRFNQDALSKDSALYAQTTASMGLNTAPADMVIKRGEEVLREVQAKSCNTPARSGFSLSDDKYDSMLRSAPVDQHDRIRTVFQERIDKGNIKSEQYQDMLDNLSPGMNHDGVGSSGTTYQEALSATDKATAHDLANRFRLDATLTDMHKAGMQGGMYAAGGAAVFEGARSIYRAYNDDIQFGDALQNMAVGSAKAFTTGYVTTAVSKGVTHTTSHLLGEGVGQTMMKSNASTAIAYGIVQSGKSMVSYLNGEIDEVELGNQISHTAITGSASFYYGAVGQMLIPIPVVGALVGSTVGYFVGNMIFQSGLVSLGEPAVVKAAIERRKRIEAMCLTVIPKINQERLRLEQVYDQHFTERKIAFHNTFNSMDALMREGNVAGFIHQLEQFNQVFGKSLGFRSFSEFDKMMSSPDAWEF